MNVLLLILSVNSHFARTEGILPAPKPAQAVKAVIDEALRCRERNEEKVILFLLCGHGFFDMKAYEDYLAGRLQAYSHPREEIMKSIGRLKALYPWIDQLPY